MNFEVKKVDASRCGVTWDSYQAVVKENENLKSELKIENTSHNYHCKESQRKNDVIIELTREKIELIESLEFYSDNNNIRATKDKHLNHVALLCLKFIKGSKHYGSKYITIKEQNEQ